ncbi:MAG TPA: hypothetical protein VK527_10360 [Candidatus Limnocylindrales bacterium]|nr:hypothetical protein [Candidatus Limnocylindrales bacterium]
MFTGISSRGLALAAAASLLACGASQAQSLKLASLNLPADVQPGSWISYRVTVESKNRPPRRFTQRLAVVSRDGSAEESGAWVELKRMEGGKVRLERGFFARPEHAGEARDSMWSGPRLTLARYQRLTPEGKLLEYAVGDDVAPPPDDDISPIDLLEFSGGGSSDSLAPDTLRMGHMIIPCSVRRYRYSGGDDWQGADTTSVNRVIMVRTLYRSPDVAVTGYARSIVEVSTERVPVAPTPAAVSDSAGAAAPSPGQGPGRRGIMYRTDVLLLDMGNDAVPEVTQPPEPAPQETAPRAKRVIK